MRCNRLLKVLSVLMLLPVAGGAMRVQQPSKPGLHRRSDGNAIAQNESGVNLAGKQSSTLPDDVSGAYHFDHDNESIEIDIERNNRNGRVGLSGYISQLGDAETDANTPLTFFFDKASVDGSQIEFQTRVLHGVWYSFRGTILRGKANERDEDGYYVLHGVLQQHHPQDSDQKSANETVESRTVNFKSMGR